MSQSLLSIQPIAVPFFGWNFQPGLYYNVNGVEDRKTRMLNSIAETLKGNYWKKDKVG